MSSYCDLLTAQVINGSKTLTSTLNLQNIDYPTDFTRCNGIIYYQGFELIINSKKKNATPTESVGNRIKFFVSPKNGLGDDLALTIQGNSGTTNLLTTSVTIK